MYDMNTKMLTRGAMVCAIYGALLLINQQTALSLETAAPWVFVFPVLIYTAQSTPYAGGLVAIAMALMSFLFGSFTTWFYSWCSIAIGWIYGIGILKQWKNMTNFAICLILSLISTALTVTVWAGIFGMDLSEDFAILHKIVPNVDFFVFMILFIILMGLLQALCIHLVSIMVCIRLKIPTRPLHSIRSMHAPSWIGAVSLLIWFIYLFGQNMVECSQNVRNIFQLLWFLDCFVLVYFGVLFLLDACIRHNIRKMSFFVIFGAFIPIVNFVWMAFGELDCLLQLRETIQDMETEEL